MRLARRLLAILPFLLVAHSPAAAIDFETKKNEPVRASGLVSALPVGRLIGDVSFSCSTNASGRCSVREFMRDAKVCALLVIKRGTVRMRKFGGNFATCGNDDGEPPSKLPPEKRLLGLASVTKSVVSVLTGHAIAVSTGAKTRRDFERVIDRPIGWFVPELQDSAYGDVPLRQVLSMRSGVRWRESFWPWGTNDARDFRTNVRERPKKTAIVKFAAGFQVKRALPGERFDYMALDPNVAALALTRMLGGQVRLTQFLARGLWRGIGAKADASWGIDKIGSGIADCCAKMSLDDLGRFGLLVLRRGRGPWGAQLIPSAWFDISLNGFQDIPSDLADQNPGCRMRYGYFWWQREGHSDFSAVGVNGQFVHIYPDENALVVQISDWRRWRNAWECDSLRLHDALVQAG